MTNEETIKALEQTRWIPCSERLPDIDEDVLVYDGMDRFIAWFVDDGFDASWHSFDGAYDPNRSIIAWMPLPEPYKAENEGSRMTSNKDCISREEVHGLIAPWLSDYLLDETREVLEVIDYKIEDLPSVQSARTHGK